MPSSAKKTAAKAVKTTTKARNREGIADFAEVFSSLKGVISLYEPPLEARTNEKANYQLYSTKEVTIAGRPTQGVYFAGAVIQKTMVSLYFFPIYTHPHLFGDLPDELRKCLKGKNCFNFKAIDPKLLKQIDKMVKQGYKIYRQEKWI